MRIALIARGCRPGAGIENYTYELARRLARRHEVHLLSRPREVSPCGARVLPVRCPSHPLWFSILRFSRTAGQMARQGSYDVVHTQGSDGDWGDVVTAHSCHAAGMWASLQHRPGLGNRLRKSFSPAHRVILELERGTFRRAGHLVAVSRRVGLQLRAVYPATRKIPLQVVYPGVHLPSVSAAERKRVRGELAERLGYDAHAVVFALVANALKLKGADRVIESLARVRHPGAVLLLASRQGEDPDLAELARRRGLAARVRFLPPGADPRPVFAAADVYIALPEYEAFGLAILEAMAFGLPLIITRNAGAAEILGPAAGGFRLPSRADTRTVAGAMDRLAADARARLRLGRAARAAAANWSWDKTAERLEEIYACVAAARAGR